MVARSYHALKRFWVFWKFFAPDLYYHWGLLSVIPVYREGTFAVNVNTDFDFSKFWHSYGVPESICNKMDVIIFNIYKFIHGLRASWSCTWRWSVSNGLQLYSVITQMYLFYALYQRKWPQNQRNIRKQAPLKGLHKFWRPLTLISWRQPSLNEPHTKNLFCSKK